MRNRTASTTIFLALVALPLLGACGDDKGGGITDPTPRPPLMRIFPDVVALTPGEVIQLEVRMLFPGEALPPPDANLVWTSSDEDVIQSLGNGRFRALEPGEAFITADYKGRRAEAWVQVTRDDTRGRLLKGHIAY